MAKKTWHIMMELDQMGTLSDISDPEMPWDSRWTMPAFPGYGTEMHEGVHPRLPKRHLIHQRTSWCSGRTDRSRPVGSELDWMPQYLRCGRKAAGNTPLQMVEYQGPQQHTRTFADRTDSFPWGSGRAMNPARRR